MSRFVKLVLLAAVGLAVALPTAWLTFDNSERHLVIGAHDAVLSPRFDGYAVIDAGPLLPRMRLPSGASFDLGVDIRLGDSEVTSLDQLVARDAVIASQPEGEIARVREALVGMLRDAALRGLGAGALAVVLTVTAWRAVGVDRRRALRRSWRHASRRQIVVAAGTGVVVVASVALVLVPERPQDDLGSGWVPLDSLVPNLPGDPVLDQVQLADGSATRGGQALIEGALDTYRASVTFYGDLAKKAEDVVVRKPDEGQTTAIVVTDRHDNIGMDPVARAVARQAEASMLIDLGDDTSNGGSWEEFSINSLAREFRGLDVVAVAGNHDTGPYIRGTMEDAGFTVLAGEPTDVGGVRFLGGSDPRSSGLTAGYNGDETDNTSAIRRQDELLTKAACDDGDVGVLVVHSSASAREASASGCVDLVLSCHLHRQVGPSVVEGANGRPTVTLTTGSTGGAVYAFALGSKLRRQAQVTLVTFGDEGRPVGLQLVDFEPGGIINVQPYTTLQSLIDDAAD